MLAAAIKTVQPACAPLPRLIVDAGIACSMSEARRLIGQGGITVDGVVVATMTTAAIVAANSGLLHAAGLYGGPPPIRFNASLLVEALSSVTETDKLTLSYLYNLN